MKRRRCRDFAEARSAYVDGHLGESERQALLRHLSDCSACRQDVAELRRLRSLLTDTGRTSAAALPADLSARLAAIADRADRPAARRRVWAVPAAGVAIVLCLIAGIGYLAAPAQSNGIADPSGPVRADFSATLDQLPLTSEAVAAALLVDPHRLRTDRTELPADPTMTGTRLDAGRIAALLRKADWATTRVAYSGVQRVIAPRDGGSTAAEVEVAFRPGRGSIVMVRNLAGDTVAEGTVPTPAASRMADSGLWDALTSTYAVSAVDGGTLLGRPVTMVQVSRHGSAPTDPPAARWWVDDQTGLVLRQQSYDHTGRLVLSAGFTEVSLGDTGVGRALAAADRPLTAPLTTAAFTTSSAGRLSSHGWFCQAELAGMSLIRLRADAPAEPGVLHMVYTDGLSTVSVFERRGALTDPPAESKWDPNLEAYRTDAMLNTATWQSGDAVFTVATDGSTALRDTVVAALPHQRPSGRSTMERIHAGWTRVLDRIR